MIDVIDEAISLTDTTWPINLGQSNDLKIGACYYVLFKNPSVGMSGGFVESNEHTIILNEEIESDELFKHFLIHELVHAEQVEEHGLSHMVLTAQQNITPLLEFDNVSKITSDENDWLPWNWNEMEREAWLKASDLTGRPKEYWFIKALNAEFIQKGYPNPELSEYLKERIK